MFANFSSTDILFNNWTHKLVRNDNKTNCMYDYNFDLDSNPKKKPEKFLIFVKRLLPRWVNAIPDSECIAIFRILKLLKIYLGWAQK